MKKTQALLMVLLTVIFAVAASPVAASVFGPTQFLCTTASKDIYNETFAAMPAEARIMVYNGSFEGTDRVSGAQIVVNGQILFDVDQFSKKIDYLEAVVVLDQNNSIAVTLRGKAGTFLTVEIVQHPTVDLQAQPPDIALGEETTLSWNSTEATACVIEPGIGTVAATGSIVVSPAQTTTYLINAQGVWGTAIDSATVTVVPPPVVDIFATPDQLMLGGTATLSWSSTDAESCVIEPDIGFVDANGSIAVSPVQTTTYTITATGPGGTSTDSVTVTVLPPPTVNITAAPNVIAPGVSCLLSWTSTDATSCVIEPDIGLVNPSGSWTVSPALTTTYTITATGPGGSVTDNVTVTVLPPPRVTIVSEPAVIGLGESSVLTWNSIDAEICVIEPGIGSVGTSGSISVSPAQTTTYVITATGPGGTASAQTAVSVFDTTHKPEVIIEADPEVISLGGVTTLYWTATNAEKAYIDNGIGNVPIAGELSVSPQNTARYKITVTSPAGVASAEVTVSVLGNPVPLTEGSFGKKYEDLIPPDATVSSYEETRFALITGLVYDANGLPLSGALISLHKHPEYGTVQSNAEGRFSIPTEGGQNQTVVFRKEGFLTLHRQVYVPWNDIANTETVQMLPVDPIVTTVTFDGNPQTVITHKSSQVIDASGSRSCSVVFTGDNHAWLTDENGEKIESLSKIDVRATEYLTPESMPAVLPPTIGFTYCSEVEAVGVDRIRFDDPVTVWVDNFLGFEIGTPVPVGYYDRDRGLWVPSDNGVVVILLDTDSDGAVDALDATGDGAPDDLDGDGAYQDEVRGLGNPLDYPPNSTYQRFEVKHFTPLDANYLVGWASSWLSPNPSHMPTAGGQGGQDGSGNGGCGSGSGAAAMNTGDVTGGCPEAGSDDSCKTATNSYVEDRNQIFHEDIPIPGTDIALHYASNRVKDYLIDIHVPAIDAEVSPDLEYIVVEMELCGQKFSQQLPAQPWQSAHFRWNGLDYLGRPVNGKQTAHIRIGYAGYAVYGTAVDTSFPIFGRVMEIPTGIESRKIIIDWKQISFPVHAIKGMGDIAEGWRLSNHHHLNGAAPDTLYKGDGSTVQSYAGIIDTKATFENGTDCIAVDGVGNVYVGSYACVYKVTPDGEIIRYAGTGSSAYSGDGGLAINARISFLQGLAVDAAGNLYIADSDNHRIRKVDTSGIITTVVGNGTAGFSGDGGPAVDASLNQPWALAVDATGSLYIADHYNHRIRKVTPDGIIFTIAGGGTSRENDVRATDALLIKPAGVAVDPNGIVYFSEIYDTWGWVAHYQVRQIDIGGMIKTVAGGVYGGGTEDGIPATSTELGIVGGIMTDAVGNLYIAGYNSYDINYNWGDYNHRVRMVRPDGIITTVAGSLRQWIGYEYDDGGYSGDGGPATLAKLNNPKGVAVDGGGTLFIADYTNRCIRKVSPFATFKDDQTGTDIIFAEKSGLGHVISRTGLHKQTFDLQTQTVLYTYEYNQNNQLISITDRFDNQMTIQRDNSGMPFSIISADGIQTNLLVSDGHLSQIIYPGGGTYRFEYSAGGLMTAEIEPELNRFDHDYDTSGLLTDVYDEEGGHWNFNVIKNQDGTLLTRVLSAEGNLTTYLDDSGSNGYFTSVVTDSSGGQSTYWTSADGLKAKQWLSCGTMVNISYDLDPKYQFKFVKSMSQSTSGTTNLGVSTTALTKTVSRERNYGSDGNGDGVPDLASYSLSINGESPAMVETDTVLSQRTFTSPMGRIRTSYYDPTTLLTESISVPGLADTNFQYYADGRIQNVSTGSRSMSFTYETDGHLDTVTDAMNRTTSFDYDPTGRVTDIYRPGGTHIGFAYDKNGNMTVLTNPTPLDHNFSYTRVNLAESYTTPLERTCQYYYDRDRRLAGVLFPSGGRIDYFYENGRLMQVQTPEGVIDYTYYCGQKVASVARSGQSITFDYDGPLVASETITGSLNQTLSWTYDNYFDVQSFTYAGDTVTCDYDADRLLSRAGAYEITRNPANGLAESVSASGYILSRSFNSYAEIQDQGLSVGGLRVYDYHLTFDNAGKITQKIETLGSASTVWDYTYTPLGQLETVCRDGVPVEEYAYYANGMRRSETNSLRDLTRTFDYSDEDGILSAGDASYLQNTDGFLQQKSVGSDITQYWYSLTGELETVELSDGTRIDYEYDPMGRRIVKKVNGEITGKYLWQGMTRLLAIYDATDSLVMRFEYADAAMPVAMTVGGVRYYLIFDQVGSLRAVVDGAGTVVKQIEYDSFGNVLFDSNPVFYVPFRFAGGLYDAHTNLIRFGYRDYDPDLGRWTSKDPIGFAGGDTDLYGYCMNDPVNGVDPLGTAQFGYRPLDFLGFIPYDGVNAFDDRHNTEWVHEQLWFDDAAKNPSLRTNIGFFGNHGIWNEPGSVMEDKSHNREDYTFRGPIYDDGIMRKALKNIEGHWDGSNYNIVFKNCQHFSDALRNEYFRLGGTVTLPAK